MKKVGIMTLYYKTYNYGAQLQAYALQKSVEKLGYECEQICYKWQNADVEHFYSTQIGNIEKFREFSFSISHSPLIYDPNNIHEADKEYDIFICGSDQIWGVTNSMPSYVVPHMALSFVSENKIKFSYGASCGGAALATNQIPQLKYWASKLNALSVREQSAIFQISELTGKEVTSVLDPTMLLDAIEWNALAEIPNENEEYIFVYNIGGNAELDKAADEISKKLNCKIKTVSYSEADEAGPREFLGLIKNARFVLTNSFHGTLFSIIFHKQFYTFSIDTIQSEFSKNIRITDILEKLGLASRFADRSADIDVSAIINYDIVDPNLQSEKEISMDFLKTSLAMDNQLSNLITPAAYKNISYETVVNDYELLLNITKRNLFHEVKRNSIYVKLLRYQFLNCLLDDEPILAGKVIIYGAGKIGRLVAECSKNKVLCFVDRSDKLKNLSGLPVYHIGDPELKTLADGEDITFLVTPVWDFEDIYQNIMLYFPKSNVVSVEKVVEKLWE